MPVAPMGLPSASSIQNTSVADSPSFLRKPSSCSCPIASQGSPHDVLRNRVPLAYDPRAIDALLLTHAHLDHCGLIPHVTAQGFRGRVYATRGTVELTRLVLLDSAKLQEEFAAKHQRFKHKYPDRAQIEDRAAAAEIAAATDEDAEEATRNATPEALT